MDGNRLSGLVLALAITSLVFFLLLVLLRIPFPLQPLMSYQDALDLATPVLILPIYWLIFRQSVVEPSRRTEEVAFVAIGAVWVLGQGMHLSANSINNLIGATSLRPSQDIASLTHFYDEVLSHYLWHGAVIGMAVLLLVREWRRPLDATTTWGMTALAALLYGFTLFCIFVEGQTVLLGLPFSTGVVLFVVVRARHVLARRPVLAFFGVSRAIAFVLLTGWGLYWGGFPQFSDVGLL